MELIGPSSEAEMVLAFLRAEADSPRHGQYFAGLDRRLIDDPDITDRVQNLRRKAALWLASIPPPSCSSVTPPADR